MRLNNRSAMWLAILPGVASIGAGTIVGLTKLVSTPIAERSSFLEDFLWNPLSSSAAVGYGTFIIVILTFIVYQMARSATRISIDDVRVNEESVSDEDLSDDEKKKLEHQQQLDRIRFAFTRNRRRMADEIDRIQRNGFLNLSIGILFSVIALGILGYPLFVTSDAPMGGWLGFAQHFAPRLSVGALVQFIGFFFLRLYVAGENEIHYIRNEITNFESKMIAYHIAAVGKDATALRDIMKQLVRTERNFKLKKGEHSIYEVDRTFNDINGLLTSVASIFPKGKAK